MTQTTRRNFSLGLLAVGGTAACSNAIGSNKVPQMDAAVASSLQVMFDTYPGTRQLAKNASGMLVMPLITEAGFGLGGSFGRGALRVGGYNVDYYSAAGASAGLQFGAQQYSHVLFFMTDDALAGFRLSPGWVAGANVEYAYRDQGDSFAADTTTTFNPVIAVVFAQAGLRLGATLEGTKYRRIIP